MIKPIEQALEQFIPDMNSIGKFIDENGKINKSEPVKLSPNCDTVCRTCDTVCRSCDTVCRSCDTVCRACDRF